MKLVIDIEANDLYHKVTDIFIISTLNIDTG